MIVPVVVQALLLAVQVVGQAPAVLAQVAQVAVQALALARRFVLLGNIAKVAIAVLRHQEFAQQVLHVWGLAVRAQVEAHLDFQEVLQLQPLLPAPGDQEVLQLQPLLPAPADRAVLAVQIILAVQVAPADRVAVQVAQAAPVIPADRAVMAILVEAGDRMDPQDLRLLPVIIQVV